MDEQDDDDSVNELVTEKDNSQSANPLIAPQPIQQQVYNGLFLNYLFLNYYLYIYNILYSYYMFTIIIKLKLYTITNYLYMINK
jgi:hypothetical protein